MTCLASPRCHRSGNYGEFRRATDGYSRWACDVIELFSEISQAEFATCYMLHATCYFLVGGHTVTPDNTVGVPFCYPV